MGLFIYFVHDSAFHFPGMKLLYPLSGHRSHFQFHFRGSKHKCKWKRCTAIFSLTRVIFMVPITPDATS